MDAGLIAGPLTSLSSKAAFDVIDPQLSVLPIFIERNARAIRHRDCNAAEAADRVTRRIDRFRLHCGHGRSLRRR